MNTPPLLTLNEIVRLVRGLTPLEKLKVMEQIAPEQQVVAAAEIEDFERLMSEADADTVAVGHMDDSRQAMYTRVDGE